MELTTSTSLLLFTLTDVGGRSLFRAVTVELAISPGEGRLLLDVARGNRFDPSWQRHLQHLAAVGSRHYDLPWDRTDLRVSSRGKGLSLEGWSASLPVFVAWVALLAGAPLPEPFLAAGVAADDSDALLPSHVVQGKLDFADACVRQRHGAGARHRMWIPAGSQHAAARLGSIEVREIGSLREAVRQILGVESAPSPRAVEAS